MPEVLQQFHSLYPLGAYDMTRFLAYVVQANVEVEGDYGLPEVLQQFHSLYPLEDLAAAEAPSPVFGVPTQLVKGVASLDGQAAALRRVDGRQVRATWRPLNP